MDTTLDQEENQKNIYVIRRKLAALNPVPGRNFYEWEVERYLVRIFPPNRASVRDEGILFWEEVDVQLIELHKHPEQSNLTYDSTIEVYIDLRSDPTFKDYKPIQYNVVTTPNVVINLGNGDDMPILQLCELIRYLYRLTSLTAFL